MEINKENIAALVVKIQNGDMSAFEELYKTVSPRSFFIALEITKNEQDSEDILQESFISALEKINTLDKPESFISWFNMIVANKSKDFLKKKKPMLFDEEEKQVYETVPDDDREFSPHENFNDAETRQIILDVVNELSDEKRMCVLLYYYDEMSISDIAKTVGANENTVKSRLFQARKDLETKFRGLEKKGIRLYGASPVGLMLWAWRGYAKSASEAFSASEASATVLSEITANAVGTGAASVSAGAQTAAAAANSVAANATAAAGTAVSGAAASTGVSAGAGIAAKIASFTVIQKVAAGIAIVGVVGGSAAGGAAVLKNSVQNETEPASVTSEEFNIDYTISQGYAAVPVIAETETTDKIIISTPPSISVSSTEKKEPTGTAAVTEETGRHETQATTKKPRATKPTTTRRDYSLDYTKPTTTLPPETTTQKPHSTTTQAQTEKATDPPKITEATTKLPDPVVKIKYYKIGVMGTMEYPAFSVPPGTALTMDYIIDTMLNDASLGITEVIIDSGDFTDSAESGKIYYFEVSCE